MEDFENLVVKAKENDMEIMLDLVLNHTSTEHIWFQKALRGGDGKYKDYYIFKKNLKRGGRNLLIGSLNLAVLPGNM